MRRIKYFFKNYKYDIIATISAIILVFVSQKFKNYFWISFIIIFIFLLAIIYLRARNKDFYFISLTNRKQKDDWIGRGGFNYDRVDRCFYITESESGFIYSNCLTWSNYTMSFEFKIVKTCLGVIIRAVNLSNYVMLQITPNGFRPHIRINGGWKVWEAKDVELEFKKGLSIDRWYGGGISCEGNSIKIKVFDINTKESIFDRVWDIKENILVFHYKEDVNNNGITTKIPFSVNLEYGSIGFRNDGSEKALVKNVLIEKNG